METLEFIKKAEGGKIIIEVPENLEGKGLKVLVMENEEEKVKKFHEMPQEERLRILKQYAGTAKYPDADTDKYSVYEQ